MLFTVERDGGRVQEYSAKDRDYWVSRMKLLSVAGGGVVSNGYRSYWDKQDCRYRYDAVTERHTDG